jgi:hypothetical protein
MGKKRKSRGAAMGRMLRQPIVREAVAGVIASAVVALAAWIRDNRRVRRAAAAVRDQVQDVSVKAAVLASEGKDKAGEVAHDLVIGQADRETTPA